MGGGGGHHAVQHRPVQRARLRIRKGSRATAGVSGTGVRQAGAPLFLLESPQESEQGKPNPSQLLTCARSLKLSIGASNIDPTRDAPVPARLATTGCVPSLLRGGRALPAPPSWEAAAPAGCRRRRCCCCWQASCVPARLRA